MFLFAETSQDSTIIRVVIGLSSSSNFSIKLSNPITNNKITIGESDLDVSKFLKNLKYFKVQSTTIQNSDVYYATFKEGYDFASLDDSKTELNSTIPMAYTRANTVVNFGSL